MADQRAARYLKKYGITIEEYEAMEKRHDGKCWICSWKRDPEKHNRLAVDHDHEVENRKIESFKYGTNIPENAALSGWHAYAEGLFGKFGPFKTRAQAVAAVKHRLKRASVRGLLCWFCNTMLKKAKDDAGVLLDGGAYLKRYLTEGTKEIKQ